jgi:HPr kinase/phosphorylase
VGDRLVVEDDSFVLLDVPLPLVRIPVKPGRSLAMLIETATRDRLLRGRGRNSALEFAARIDRAAAGFDRDHG